MSFSSEARQYAFDVLENRRTYDIQENERRKESLINSFPEISFIDSEISRLGILLLQNSISGNNDNCENIKNEINDLRSNRKNIINDSSSPDLFREYHYCEKCNDTGFLPDGHMCECVISLMKRFSADTVNMSSGMTPCHFDSFSLDFYSSDTDPDFHGIPKERAEKNLKAAKSFTADFPDCRDLLIVGDTGLGKTHLAMCIASEIIEKGYYVIYCSAPTVLSKIETEHFSGQGNESLEKLKEADLLILDDLGAEFITPYLITVLYDLYNSRILSGKKTVFTSNIINISELETRYGEKISSRLRGNCRILPFFGDDIRLIKK